MRSWTSGVTELLPAEVAEDFERAGQAEASLIGGSVRGVPPNSAESPSTAVADIGSSVKSSEAGAAGNLPIAVTTPPEAPTTGGLSGGPDQRNDLSKSGRVPVSPSSETHNNVSPFRPLGRAVRLTVQRLFREPFLWVTILLAATWTVVLSWVQVLDYQSFFFTSGDLGSYNQAFYTTAKLGRVLYYTPNLPGGSNGSVFAVHFAPFLFLVVPFYALAPGPATLLIMKEAALAAAAIPLYKLAEFKVRSTQWAILISVVYLLCPLTVLSGTLSGFDPEEFIPVLLLSALYFAARGRTTPFLLFWILTLSVIETEGPILAIFGLAWILGTVTFAEFKAKKLGALRGLPTLATVIALVWTGLSFAMLHYLGPRGGGFGTGYGARFTVLGATSVLGIPLQVLLHPANAIAALAFDWQYKLLFAVLVLGGVGFIPIVGQKRFLLPIFAWLIFVSLQSTGTGAGSMYVFGNQYLCYVTPFVFTGLVSGLVRLGAGRHASPNSTEVGSENGLIAPSADRGSWRARLKESGGWSYTIAAILVAALIATSLAPSDVAASNESAAQAGYVPLIPTSHDRTLQDVIDLIPASASVFVTPHVFPQVSNRADAYTITSAELFSPPWTYNNTVDRYVNWSDFVLIDNQLDFQTAHVYEIIANQSLKQSFGLVAAVNGSDLYERGWSGSPAYWAPVPQQTFGAATLGPTSPAKRVNNVTNPFGGTTIYAQNLSDDKQQIWGGPNVDTLPVGRYEASVWMSVWAPSAPVKIELQVKEHPMVAVVEVNPSLSIGGIRYTLQLKSSNSTIVLANATPSTSQFQHTIEENITFNWSGLGYLNIIGNSETSHLSLYVYAIVVRQIGP